MNLKYDGKVIGTITTNRSLTIEECLDIIGIDPEEMEDENTAKWDYELFEMDYDTNRESEMKTVAIPKPTRAQQNFRLDGPTRTALKFISAKEKRNQTQIIEFAVEEYFLKHYERQLGDAT